MHSGKIDLWQGCHRMGEKRSKIVPLGAPLLPAYNQQLAKLIAEGLRTPLPNGS